MTGRIGRARACLLHRAGTTESTEASNLAYLMDLAQDRLQFDLQLVERQFDCRRSRADQHQTRGQRTLQIRLPQNRTKLSPSPISSHRRAERASDRIGHRHRVGFWVGTTGTPQGWSTDSFSVRSEAFERLTVANPRNQADRRARPRARRFLITARPPRVLIRERNPCFFALLWVLG
jgi:hypothetical protein